MKNKIAGLLSDDSCRKILRALPDGVAITDTRGKIRFVTPKILEIFGGETEADATGTLITDWIAPENREKAQADLENLYQGIDSPDNEFILCKKDGTRFFGAINSTVIKDEQGRPVGMISTIRDISEKKEILAKIREQDAQLKRLNRIYRVISSIQKAISHCRKPETLFREACRIAVREGGFRMAWIGILDETTGMVEVKVHAGVARDYLKKLKISLKNSERGKGPAGRAISIGKHVICNDIEHDPAMKPWRADAIKAGYRSSGAFPLQPEGHVKGTINLYAHEPDFFNEEETRLLDELAADISFALENLKLQEERKKSQEALQRKTEELDRYFESSLDLLCIADTDGYFRKLNPEWNKTLGYPIEELIDRQFLEFVHPDDLEPTKKTIANLASQKEVLNFVNRYRCKDGSFRWIEWRSYPEGEIIYAVARDITERKRQDILLEGQAQALEMIALAAPLEESLDKLLRVVETLSDGMLASILLLDNDGIHVRHAAAPSLPKEYIDSIDGSMIGEQAGSCGTAAYTRKQVVVEDILTDPLWTDYRELASRFDLRACWSTPIFDPQQCVLGTFALYFHESRLPSPFDRWLIGLVTHVAAIAISKSRESEALKETERYNRFLFETTPTGLALCHMDGSMVDVNPAFAAIIGRDVEETEQLSYWDITPEKYREQEGIQVKSLLTTGSYGPYEKEYLHADGHLVPVRLFGRIIELKGEPYIWSSVEDITEQMKHIAELAERVLELETIHQTSQRLHSLIPPDDLAREIITILEKHLEYKFAAVLLIEKSTSKLLPFAISDQRKGEAFTEKDMEYIRSHNFCIGEGITGKVAETGISFCSGDVSGVPDYKAIRQDIQSELCVPLYLQNEVIGVINIETDQANAYDLSDQRVLETIAAQISVAIQNSQLLEEVKTKEATLASIFNTVGDIIFQLAVEPANKFRFVSVNPAFTRVTGLKKETIVGKKVEEVIPEPSLAMVLGHYRKAIKSKGPVKWEETTEYPAGRLTGEVTIAPLFDEKGTCTHLVGSVHDITERKFAETIKEARFHLLQFSATHSMEELLQATLDELEELTGSQIGFYHFLEENQETLSLQTWSTRTLQEMCKAESTGRHYKVTEAGVWVDCIRERRPVIHNDYISLPHRKGMPEGHAEVIRELVVPVFREDRIVAILGIGNKPVDYTELDIKMVTNLADQAWDIVRRKQVEKERLETETRFRTLFENSMDAVLLTAPDGSILEVNEATCRMFGRTAEEMRSLSRAGVADPTDPRLAEALKERERTGSVKAEFTMFRSGGIKFPAEVSSTIFTDSKGQQRTSMIIRDISERKLSEEKIMEQLNELQRWYEVMIGREGRNMELKREINDLLRQLGKPVKYESQDKPSKG